MGHKRAMTLPQLGLGRDGLPVPLSAGAGGAEGGLGGEGGLVVEEDVPGAFSLSSRSPGEGEEGTDGKFVRSQDSPAAHASPAPPTP